PLLVPDTRPYILHRHRALRRLSCATGLGEARPFVQNTDGPNRSLRQRRRPDTSACREGREDTSEVHLLYRHPCACYRNLAAPCPWRARQFSPGADAPWLVPCDKRRNDGM